MLRATAPGPDLDGIVESCIVVRQHASASVSRFPAMPRAMVTVSPAAGGEAAVAFHAMSTRPVAVVHDRPFAAWGLVLPPVTAARLMGPVTGALVDTVLPWAELAGPAAWARLQDALALAASDDARLRLLQDSLRRMLAHEPDRAGRRRAALLQRLCLDVGRNGVRAAASLGMSERQLERHCRAWLGLSPKRLQRLTRFHAMLADAARRGRLPDADTALAAGYYDQSHLARDAWDLAGAPMREMLAGAHAGGQWWPLASQRLARGARG